MRLSKIVCLLLAGSSLAARNVLAAGNASHVVLMVWDGMRPDFVSQENTPNLWQLAHDGVFFAHHHPVYVSSTEVNGVAIATGVYPGQSTIIANNEYRPAIDAITAVAIQDTSTIRKGDEVEERHYLRFPTLAEILRGDGLRTAITGSKPVALLHDRAERAEGSADVVVFAGDTLPAGLAAALDAQLGQFPPAAETKIKQDQWTTSALTDAIWKDNLPAYSLLWMAEPDFSQHKYGPGAPDALKAIKNNDDCLGRVIAALKAKNQFDSTDIIVISDHGFSTVKARVDVAGTLNAKGFHVLDKFSPAGPGKGELLAVSDGGIVLLYSPEHDATLVERAVHCLQTQAFAGVLLSRDPVAGAFTFADLHLDSPYVPDCAVIMRWDLGRSVYGAPGMIYCDGSPNKGSHATLCPTEMHNLGIASGPDFVHGLRDPLASGNIDIAPTILWILGVHPVRPMSGRVLSEALSIPGPEITSVQRHRKQANWHGEGFVWNQYLQSETVNGVTYYDEGNGAPMPSGAGRQSYERSAPHF